MHPTRFHFLVVATILTLTSPTHAADPADAALRKEVTFYASFDDSPRADFGGGELTLRTRSNHPTEKGKFVFEKDFNVQVFHIACG